MHFVYVHDAKIAKENGFTLQFCSNYPPKMSRICAMYTFLTNYNTIWERFLPNAGKMPKDFAEWKYNASYRKYKTNPSMQFTHSAK